MAQFIINPNVGTSVVRGPNPRMDKLAYARIAEEICRIMAITT